MGTNTFEMIPKIFMGLTSADGTVSFGTAKFFDFVSTCVEEQSGSLLPVISVFSSMMSSTRALKLFRSESTEELFFSARKRKDPLALETPLLEDA